MDQPAGKFRIPFAACAALLGWFAVIAQLYLMLANRNTSAGEAVMRFFSYFTILTNMLVATALTASLLKGRSSLGKFLTNPVSISAITVYIVIVGLIYNLMLRSLWKPEGLQYTVDELLHTFMPLLFLVYWIVFVPKHALRWKHAFPWLFYPFFYLAFVLIRGYNSGFYPYFFIDIDKLGYPKTLIYSFLLGLIFLGFSLGLIGLSKIGKHRARHR